MWKKIMQLGRSPLTRRVVAAILLFVTAALTAIIRGPDSTIWIDLAINFILAALALAFLHYRWKVKVKRRLDPNKVKDIFS